MISPLQLGLIALGALFILGLVLFNWWQERSIRRDMVRRFDGPIDDVLMGKPASGQATAAIEEDFLPEEELDELEEMDTPQPFVAVEDTHQEPDFDDAEFVDADDVDADETDAPLVEETHTAPNQLLAEDEIPAATHAPIPEPLPITPTTPAVTTAEPATPLPEGVDPGIDEIAVLNPSEACSGSTLRSSLNPVADFGKPVRWFGWSQDAWLPLTREFEQRKFSRIIGALQLADRSGVIQADGLLGFQDQIEHLAANIGASLSWFEQRETLRYASMLDQLCIEVDVTVTLHVTAGVEGPFAGTKLRGLAEAAGLKLKEDGRFHQMNDAGETLYTLSSADQRPLTEEGLRSAMLHDMVLMLDVPRVAKGGEVFRHMAMFGARLETTLNARLTDTSRRALGDVQLEQIRSQIHTIHSKLLAHRITPGGASALRLFS